MYKCPKCKKTSFNVGVIIENVKIDEKKEFTIEDYLQKEINIEAITCYSCDYCIEDRDEIDSIFGESCSVCGSKENITNGICKRCLSIYSKVAKAKGQDKVQDKPAKSTTTKKKATKKKIVEEDIYSDEYDDEDDYYAE